MGGKASRGTGGKTPDVISPTPAAVVVDTNLWSNGILDVGRLKALADRLVGSRIEVWVPTQVLWEWASHAVNDAKLAAPIWNRLKRTWLVEGSLPVTTDVTAMLTALETTLKGIPNVVIVPMTGAAAVAGLKDQVLGTGPGTSPSGVKTGAVDSSLVRDAIAHAGGDASKLVFLTNNAKDVHATVKAMDVTVHVRPEDTLYASLFPAVAEPEALVEVIFKELEEQANPDTDHHPAYLMEPLLPVSDIHVPSSVFDPPDPFELTGTTLAYGGSVVAITDVEVLDGLVKEAPADASSNPAPDAPLIATTDSALDGADDGGSDVATPSWTVAFTAVLLGDVEAVGYQIDNDGQVLSSAGVIENTVILAPLVADLVDRSVQSLTANGSARAVRANPTFADSEDALAWVLAELSAFHGVELDDDDTSLEEFTFRGAIAGWVTATRSGLEDWKLTFDLGYPHADAVISCHYDPGARVWAGRASFDAQDPFYVVSGDEGGDLYGPSVYYAMSDVWRRLNGLYR